MNRGLVIVFAIALIGACTGGAEELVITTTAPTSAANSGGSTDTTSGTVGSTPLATASPVTTASTPATTGAVPSTTEHSRRMDFSAVSEIIGAFVEEHGLNGAGVIVVARDQGVLHHEHFGEFDEDRISLVASSTKMITAGVVLHLHDQGLLDIDAPVADVVEWGAANPDITPAQLISNSSGLAVRDPVYPPYICVLLPEGTMQECAETVFTTPDDDADIVPPDTEFRYGAAAWQVAGAVAEVAAGTSWSRLVDEIYVQPCGVESLGYNNHWAQPDMVGDDYPVAFAGDPGNLRPTDNPEMGGGAYITTGDYGTLLLMHLEDGRCGDTQVISPESLARAHEDRIGSVYGGDAVGPEWGYGMGWFVDRETGYVIDPGSYGSRAWLDLDDGYGVFVVIEANGSLGKELATRLFDVVDEIMAAR